MDELVAVRQRIAEAILNAAPVSERLLGDVVLRPHQVEAVERLRASIAEYGGALLSDAPGLGKTFTALAVARSSPGVVVVAPAALKAQWLASARRADVAITWCSLEKLSRQPVAADGGMLIVDEAHHLRNAGTRRYAHAAQLAVGKHVLLLSATPIHNRPGERDALLALFLGTDVTSLSDAALARIIVRRRADAALLPQRTGLRWIAIATAPDVGALLRALPPPLPAADGRAALALIRMTLAHAWSSSLAALDATVQRGVLQAAAIDDSLAVGRWPTRGELRAWVSADNTSQLAFPELMATPTRADIHSARTLLATHRSALSQLRAAVAPHRTRDIARRAEALRALMRRHPRATILAFTRYAATVDALWRELQFDVGVVAITSRAVRSAGGGLRRDELLSMMSSDGGDRPRMPLHLVLATDLLGEGLDLRAASVLVHLDLPWTAARLEQREGRATRLGSPHRAVAVYAFRPPRIAARLLTLMQRLSTKRAAMAAGLAAGDAREALCALVRPWLTFGTPVQPRVTPPTAKPRVAAVGAACDAWIAVVRDARDRVRIIASDGDSIMERDDRLHRLLSRTAHRARVRVPRERAQSAMRTIRAWLRRGQSAHAVQADRGAHPARALIARRMDVELRRLPLNERAALQSRYAMAMSALGARRSAGVDRLLHAAARCESVLTMLESVEAITRHSNEERPAARRSRLLALLILVRNDRAATGPSSARRSAASSGTAAPR